jgi:transcriptional regulator GlxA family with amidase domain
MRKLLRVAIYLLILILPQAVTVLLGASSYANVMYGDVKTRPGGNYNVEPPPYDPSKPTVAILLGSETTEIIDFLAPYELFSATESFNVFAVAPTREVTTLSGTLDILPHFSFEQLDAMLGKSPEILVVPYIFHMENKAYLPVDAYLRKHASGANTILSICGGAVNLAKAGLLDGKSAATHWSRIEREMENFPAVHWIRDRRFVVDGKIVSSAGLTSGIDASLFVISSIVGEQKAASAANTIQYSSLNYLHDTTMVPHDNGLEDAPYYLNIAFSVKKQNVGVLLYDGIQETALASVFDTHPASATTRAFSIGAKASPVKTRHQLYLLPRYHYDNAPAVDRMIVTGTNALRDAKNDTANWFEMYPNMEMIYMHAYQPDRFVLEAPLEDLAKRTNIPTAEYALKRLEYRQNALNLEGSRVMMSGVVALPASLGLLSLLLVVYLEWRRRRQKPCVQ